MGFLAGYALSMFARPQDRLSHVLVAEPFQSHPDFHFPPRAPKLLKMHDGRAVSTAEANLVLAEIPIVRLRDRLPAAMLSGDLGYSQAVAEAQRALDPPKMIVVVDDRKIICADTPVELRPATFAFALWLAERARELGPQAGAVHWADADRLELAAVFSRLGLADPPGSGHNLEETWFREQKSRLSRALRAILGEAAGPYLPKPYGSRPRTRTGFALNPAQIEVKFSASH